jgi:hypothetical protein
MEGFLNLDQQLVEIEQFATQVRTIWARVNAAFGPLIMMVPPPPPPPPVYTNTEFKKVENFNGWSIAGGQGTKSETGPAGERVITSQGGKVPAAGGPPVFPTLTVNHPPPPGSANQTHTLHQGDRVTVYPNGNILIETQ